MLYAAEHDGFSGPVNGVAPEPVTNREFTRILAQLLRRPAFFPVSGFVLQLALGEFATVLLASQRVISEKISQTACCRFVFSALKEALEDLL
jgi:hypothetical protein